MKLALVTIVRDEARCIGRCLASVKPWVDEMVVVDTGSIDATCAMSAEAGARVAHFEWIDDFSAARNAALDAADADWSLVLDADEWLVDGGEFLRLLRESVPDHIGLIEVASEFDQNGHVQISRNALPRLLPRGVRYSGRVHEQPESSLPRRTTPVRIGHDGYRDALKAAKRGRNLRLLQAELALRPDDPYVLYQLGNDHGVHGDYASACDHYARSDVHAPLHARYRHDLVVRWLFALKTQARHEEAVQLAEREMKRFSESPDFYFALGDLLLDWAAREPQRAGELLPMIESAWRRCLEIGERPDLEGAVAGRGSHLAAHNLAVFLEGTGRLDEAQALRALTQPR